MSKKYSQDIQQIIGREILDSRGIPTVSVEVHLGDGSIGIASVPSGASTGRHEAVELRDGDPDRFFGSGVLKAIFNINTTINTSLAGSNAYEQINIDQKLIDLDGTENKSNLGANATLGVSLAVAQASAVSKQIPLYKYLGMKETTNLPVPLFNILNGGKHAQNSTDFQEFMIVPLGINSFPDALRAGSEIYYSLKKFLNSEGLGSNVGDEGGFAPSLKTNREALEVIMIAINNAGYTAGKDIYLALDVAATELFEDGKYFLSREMKSYKSPEMVQYYKELIENFPVISIEDGMAEDDWEGWSMLTQIIGHKVQLVGDDLFTTNTERIQKGINENSANSVLIKLNQIGTLSETLSAVNMTQAAGWSAIISHRSGETEDTFIADLSVSTSAGQIKTGAPARSERNAKYNRLLKISNEIYDHSSYGSNALEAFSKKF
ncbi:MAG: phosphopyruvate hydratase [Chloroflexi bacterium]|nr:phosphopyruvate hydratase [Chloroflexota bacterium]|tara:strand:+ start:18295 stop:19599 length:1305 start_codon:yes stop_codon:yes gene_type:complete